MAFLETVTQINFNTVLLAVVAILLGWREIRSGSAKITAEVIQGYKDLEAQLRAKITEYDEKFVKMTTQIGDLTKSLDGKDGIIAAKDQLISELQAINANRSPKLEQVLEEIHGFMRSLVVEVRAGKQVSIENKEELKHQTEVLEGGSTVVPNISTPPKK